MTFREFLLSDEGHLGPACEDAIDWLGDRTPTQTLADCHRGDWLLWWAKKAGVYRRKLVGCAGHCANTVRHLMKDARSIKGVDAAIAYGEGLLTEEELQAAYRAAAAAAVTVGYRSAAADAAYCAVCGNSSAAAAAADRTASDKAANQRQTADIVRRMLGDEILERTKTFVK